ncbi:MAG: beta-L-arabinofuranosidase domain-containing protein [Bryobacteraceae bacterium]
MTVTAWASPPQPVVPNAVPDRFRPFPFDNQKLAGLLVNRLRANHEGFLKHVDIQFLLQPFQTKIKGKSEAVVGGEFIGRFLQAASNAYEYTHDSQLKELMDKATAQLLSLQAKNGYFGSYSDGERWTSSDLLVHKWILLGLLSYWQATGEEDAYTASQMIGDLLVNTFGDKGKEHASFENGNDENLKFRLAALQTIESLTFLYRHTADPNYLNLCKSIVRAADVNTALITPGTKEDLPDKLRSLVGLVDLYRLTGDRTYLYPALRSWKALAGNYLSLTGTPAASPVINAVDNCTTVAWMQLTLNLLRLTGEPQYGQQLERTIYNQLLSAQDMRTGSIASEIAFAGKKNFSSKLLPSSGRCMLSEAEGLTLIPQATWGRYANGVLINAYTAGRATVQLRRRGLIQIYSEASFPETGEMLLHVEPSHNIQFSLSLRVPDWTSSFIVDTAGQHLIGKPGDLVTINREWKRGDIVKISAAMDVRILSSPDEKMGRIAIQRGPQILALGKTLNPQIEDLSLVNVLPAAPSRLKLSSVETPLPAPWQGDQVYKIEGEYKGKKQSFILVPFADAINYQVWLRKPNGPGGVEE